MYRLKRNFVAVLYCLKGSPFFSIYWITLVFLLPFEHICTTSWWLAANGIIWQCARIYPVERSIIAKYSVIAGFLVKIQTEYLVNSKQMLTSPAHAQHLETLFRLASCCSALHVHVPLNEPRQCSLWLSICWGAYFKFFVTEGIIGCNSK
jgi:hypothetical protein